mmetsp:Transcript_36519/g.63577  ORF Transcript_36519/g.63577 Transcript_36519/m.63577 type:complete len:232 (+) Transcript_36519:73-768(+)
MSKCCSAGLLLQKTSLASQPFHSTLQSRSALQQPCSTQSASSMDLSKLVFWLIYDGHLRNQSTLLLEFKSRKEMFIYANKAGTNAQDKIHECLAIHHYRVGVASLFKPTWDYGSSLEIFFDLVHALSQLSFRCANINGRCYLRTLSNKAFKHLSHPSRLVFTLKSFNPTCHVLPNCLLPCGIQRCIVCFLQSFSKACAGQANQDKGGCAHGHSDRDQRKKIRQPTAICTHK